MKHDKSKCGSRKAGMVLASYAVRFDTTSNASPATTVKTLTATMTFGDYNSGSSTFTAATAGSTVAPLAVGFTFAGLGNRMGDVLCLDAGCRH